MLTATMYTPFLELHIADNYKHSWVSKEARPISLRQLMVFGRSLNEQRLLSSANYVRTELPRRYVVLHPGVFAMRNASSFPMARTLLLADHYQACPSHPRHANAPVLRRSESALQRGL